MANIFGIKANKLTDKKRKELKFTPLKPNN
jgi:hypothetical protein